MTDPRAVLGVGPRATLEEVKAAYRRLALTHHPDRDQRPGALERMKAINAAYTQLLRELRQPPPVTVVHTATASSGMDADVWVQWSRSSTSAEECADCSFVLTFGKHRGRRLAEIARIDQQYLVWIARSAADGQTATNWHAQLLEHVRSALKHSLTAAHGT